MRCLLAATMGTPGLTQAISAVLAPLFILLLLVGLRRVVSARGEATLGLLVVLLASAVVLPILEHHLVGALYPVQRATLYYVPLYSVALLYAGRALVRGESSRWPRLGVGVLLLAVTATLGWHFGRGFAERSACAWWEDGHNREVLELIDRDRAERFPRPSPENAAERQGAPSM